jgi:hypothetical protein
MCENKDLSEIFQKYKSSYAKCLNYECNFQFLTRVQSVKVLAIITLPKLAVQSKSMWNLPN